MFGKLTDLSGSKSLTEATGLYLFLLTFLIGLSTLSVHILGITGVATVSGGFFDGGETHVMVGSLFTLLVSSLIVKSKHLTSDLLAIVLVVTGVIISYKISLVIGMIPVAYLTTLKNGKA